MLALHHFQDSVCSFKVRLCLAEKSLPWESRLVDLVRFEQLGPEYLALNPNGVVPTLVVDGVPIVESSVINEYLDDAHPDPPLRPADAIARARMRVWVKYEDSSLFPAIREPTFELLHKARLANLSDEELDRMTKAHPQPDRAAFLRRAARTPRDEQVFVRARETFGRAVARMDAALADGPWLAGEGYSLADVSLTPILNRLEVLGMADLWATKPRVQAWFARVKERPSFQLARG